MLTHIVLFKLKDRINIPQVKEILLDMAGKIPQLRHLEVGTDVLQSERSYDVALVGGLRCQRKILSLSYCLSFLF